MLWGWTDPFADIPIVAVAIAATGDNNAHVGIAYQGGHDEKQLCLLHLAWHCKLKNELLVAPVCNWHTWHFTTPNLPRAVLEVVATTCRSISRNMPVVKYGFDPQRTLAFDAHGNMINTDDRGLNCANFVLRVFTSSGVHLVIEDTWKTRQDDVTRFEELLSSLTDSINSLYCGSPNSIHENNLYIAKIAPDVTSIRIRPEEVAGACLSQKLPVD